MHVACVNKSWFIIVYDGPRMLSCMHKNLIFDRCGCNFIIFITGLYVSCVPSVAITDLQGPAVDREYLGSG